MYYKIDIYVTKAVFTHVHILYLACVHTHDVSIIYKHQEYSSTCTLQGMCNRNRQQQEYACCTIMHVVYFFKLSHVNICGHLLDAMHIQFNLDHGHRHVYYYVDANPE